MKNNHKCPTNNNKKTIQKTRTHGKNWLNSGKIISDTVKDVPRESMVVIDGRNSCYD